MVGGVPLALGVVAGTAFLGHLRRGSAGRAAKERRRAARARVRKQEKEPTFRCFLAEAESFHGAKMLFVPDNDLWIPKPDCAGGQRFEPDQAVIVSRHSPTSWRVFGVRRMEGRDQKTVRLGGVHFPVFMPFDSRMWFARPSWGYNEEASVRTAIVPFDLWMVARAWKKGRSYAEGAFQTDGEWLVAHSRSWGWSVLGWTLRGRKIAQGTALLNVEPDLWVLRGTADDVIIDRRLTNSMKYPGGRVLNAYDIAGFKAAGLPADLVKGSTP